MSDAADAALAAQYESYPYPQRDPRDEAKRLVVGSPSHLLEIDHWIFGARRPAAQPLQALMAGGGSGDATLMLAQQMASAGRAGSVTWLDRSASARKLAGARVAARSLENVTFEEGSILDLPRSGARPLRLHRLLRRAAPPARPARQGCKALVSVLAPGGGIGLMVYAPHGRTGVYMVQDALRLLAPPDQPPREGSRSPSGCGASCRRPTGCAATRWITDHMKGGDAGIYDLLLNPRDVAFTVPQLAALVAGAGLEIRCLVEPFRYDPDSFLTDPRLRERTAGLDPVQRAALAEAAAGNMGIHIVYCVRAGQTPPAARLGRPAIGACAARTGRRQARRDHPAGRRAAHRLRRADGAGRDAAPGTGDPDPGRWAAQHRGDRRRAGRQRRVAGSLREGFRGAGTGDGAGEPHAPGGAVTARSDETAG